MKKILFLFVILFSFYHINAQNVGIGTIAPTARLHVTDSSVVFSATGGVLASPGNPPVSGAGRRMMWYADKAAFRAGYVNSSQWDKDNIGNLSFAIGANNTASGAYSIAGGFNNSTSNDNAIALGSSNIASGSHSFARGLNNAALVDFSSIFGNGNTAEGRHSFITGSFNKSKSFASFITGVYNDTTVTGDANTINIANRLFQIGNGTSNTSRSNAITVLQSGNTGIGTLLPKARLHVADSSVVFDGGTQGILYPYGDPPVSGPGSRMMWYRDKAAFRVGYVSNNEWDKDNIGEFSFAAGDNTVASGQAAVALGYSSNASGIWSTALGGGLALGNYSSAVGFVTASGTDAVAIGGLHNTAQGIQSAVVGGYFNTAKGKNSMATGDFNFATGYSSFVIGVYNDSLVAPQITVQPSSPLFIIGNGAAHFSRSNAMVVRKDGSTDINGSLEVNSLKINNGAAANSFLKSDANGNASWVSGALVEIDPRVGSLTDTYFPKWNNTSTQLVNSSVRENINGVGIGITPQLNERLAVNGNISISAAYDYKYGSSKTKTMTIPASAFRLMPVNGISTAGLTFALAVNNGGGLFVDNGIASTDAFFDASLNLPVGTEITGVDLFVRDQSNTTEVSGELFRFDNIAFFPVSIGTITGTGVATTPGNTTISGIFSQITDGDNSYFIRFKTKENTIGLRIFGAKVTYRVDKVD